MTEDQLELLKHTIEATPLKELKKWVKKFAKQRVIDEQQTKDTLTELPE